MTKGFPQRIHIIGSVGSGKTTLARELSKTFQIPYYELDNVAWIRKESGDILRTDEEKKEHLQSILQTNSWIIEGIHQEEWVVDSFQQADCILFLDTPYKVRIFRIIKRFMKQKMGIEKAHYQPTFSIFFKMFRWNKRFEQKGKPRFFKQQSDLLNKILVIQQKKDLNNFLQQF